jgi:DNA-directed RNA polymerase III subunit RPC2
MIRKGLGSSVFACDKNSRDDLRYTNLPPSAAPADDEAYDSKYREEKWRLLPAFLQTKGLVKQHIDSFNYFIETDIKNIVKANDTITSVFPSFLTKQDVDPNFYLKFTDISIGFPQEFDSSTNIKLPINPHQCRIRETTYAAFITVNVTYKRGKDLVKRPIEIGRMPIMLRVCY